MFRHLLLASAVLGLLAASTESASAQKVFRGGNQNQAPPAVVFPPAPQIPLLNNGSLQTTGNPNSALPSQVPYIYIAGMAQDARLNNNGVFIWQPRLDSAVTALQNQQQNIGNNLGSNLGSNQGLNLGLNLGGNINLGGNLGLNLGGLVNGFGAMRSPALAGYGYPGYYGGLGYNPGALMGNNFGGFVSQMQGPFANPNPAGLGNNNFGPVNAPQANFFANPNPGDALANLGNFGGDANPFDIFKAAKPDANDDKKKNDEEKDNKNPARKDDDADKQR